ncbi:MAG TPA: hypothetical protein VLV48_00005, partial [Thermoanaerobaculia bacterium]|nr:hypothetical protein [Thermoanaerobaculia bacterium]
ITGLLPSSAAGRTNLMVQEVSGADALIAVDLLDANGSVIVTKEDFVPAFQHIRMSDFVPAGAAAAVIRLRGTTGSVLAYATPLDALSGDTWVVTDWPRVQGFDPAGRQIIPIAGKLEGANANYFRSTMALVNQAASAASVVARFVSNAGTVTEKTVTVPARGTVSYGDVIGELFALPSGLGFLEIDPQGTPVVVTSRTFATIGTDPKTFGTGVPAVAPASMKTGDTERISGFDDADQAIVTAKTPATFRTNLGLVETSGKGVTVRVTINFRHPVSTLVTTVGSGSKEFLLAPRQFLLLQGVAAQILGDYRASLKGSLKDLFVDIEVVSGDGEVIAFTSSVDNGTGDQLFKLQ